MLPCRPAIPGRFFFPEWLPLHSQRPVGYTTGGMEEQNREQEGSPQSSPPTKSGGAFGIDAFQSSTREPMNHSASPGPSAVESPSRGPEMDSFLDSDGGEGGKAEASLTSAGFGRSRRALLFGLLVLVLGSITVYFFFLRKPPAPSSAVRGSSTSDETAAAQDALQPKARDQVRLSAIDTIRQALSNFQSAHDGIYPSRLDDLVPQFLARIPEDPAGNPSGYVYDSTERSYTMTYTLETAQEKVIDYDYVIIGALQTIAIPSGEHQATPESIAADLPPHNANVTAPGKAPPKASEAGGSAGNANGSTAAGQAIPVDADGDGLSDEEEARFGTNTKFPDTDGDTLTDFQEVAIYKSNPLTKDSDGDSYPDNVEIAGGYNPNGLGR